MDPLTYPHPFNEDMLVNPQFYQHHRRMADLLSFRERNLPTSNQIRPVVLAPVPSLQEYAARGVVIAVCNQTCADTARRYDREDRKWNQKFGYSFDFRTLVTDIRELIVKLAAPKLILDYIVNYVDPIVEEIKRWAAHHYKTVFDHDDINYIQLYHNIPYFNWSPHGTIDYKKSALNLLPCYSTFRLSDEEKFKLACTYCLEDKVAGLIFSLMAVESELVKVKDFSSNPLISYWNCYVRHEIPLMHGDEPMDYFMFRHRRVNNWWAKEYFFDRLTSEEKVQGAISLIDKCDFGYQKLVLSKLNKSELTKVYKQRAVKIMSNYSRNRVPGREILSTWRDICYLIEANQFASIFFDLLRSRDYADILTEVWGSARDDFKLQISTYKDGQIIERIFQMRMEEIDDNEKDDEFLFTALSDIYFCTKQSPSTKPSFKIYCERLLQKRKFATFERLLGVCFKEKELLEQSRLDLVLKSTAVRNACLEYYLTGQVLSLNYFLTKVFPSRLDLVQKYKENLLMSPEAVEKFANNLGQTANLLGTIIADSLPTEELGAEFKKKILCSPTAVSILQSWLVNDRLDDVIPQVDCYLESNEEKRTFKRNLIANFEDKLITIFSTQRIENIKRMMDWCLEDDESLLRYKSSLQVDTIFNKLLQYGIFSTHSPKDVSLSRTYAKEPDFTCSDLFLNWYCENPSGVKLYKLKKIQTYHLVPVIRNLLKMKEQITCCRQCEAAEMHLAKVLTWFLDNDPEEMKKFVIKNAWSRKILQSVRLGKEIDEKDLNVIE